MSVQLYNAENDFQQLWDNIINCQYFFPVEVYYDLSGKLLPYYCNDAFNAKSEKEKTQHLVSVYGERYKDTMGYTYRNEKGEVIGWIYWGWKGKVAHLKYIVVKEGDLRTKEGGYQRQGIGKKMMNLFIEWCIENKMKSARLSFHSNNKELIKFYKSYGFDGEVSSRIFSHWERKFKVKK